MKAPLTVAITRDPIIIDGYTIQAGSRVLAHQKHPIVVHNGRAVRVAVGSLRPVVGVRVVEEEEGETARAEEYQEAKP